MLWEAQAVCEPLLVAERADQLGLVQQSVEVAQARFDKLSICKAEVGSGR